MYRTSHHCMGVHVEKDGHFYIRYYDFEKAGRQGILASTSLQLLRNGHRDGETPRVTVLEYSGAVLNAASRVCSFSHCKHISVPAFSSKSKP